MSANSEGMSFLKLLPYALTRLGMAAAENSSLFRYVGLQSSASWDLLAQTILRNRLPLATTSSLNDPFDSDPIIVNDATTDQIRSFLKKGVLLNDRGEPTPFDWSSAEVRMPDGSVLSGSGLEAHAASLIKKIWSEISRQSYVGSFCRRISSQLLWSHYADKYRGLVYHFVVRDDVLRFARPVNYERQRPIILLSEMLQEFGGSSFGHADVLHWHQRTYLTKSIEWAYEEESRLIGRKSEVEFAPQSLAALIVGPFFSSENLTRLKQITDQRQTGIPIFRAKIAKTDYAIEIDWDTTV